MRSFQMGGGGFIFQNIFFPSKIQTRTSVPGKAVGHGSEPSLPAGHRGLYRNLPRSDFTDLGRVLVVSTSKDIASFRYFASDPLPSRGGRDVM